MLITLVNKKGDKSLPENYRTIALLSTPGKALNKILLSKIREKELFTNNRQYGFRPNRGTIDAFFVVRQLMQNSKERWINCHYHFVDFKNAFDTIRRKTLWKMMRSIGICNKIVNIIEKMLEKTTCTVDLDGLLTDWFSVKCWCQKMLEYLQEHVTLDYELNVDGRYVDLIPYFLQF